MSKKLKKKYYVKIFTFLLLFISLSSAVFSRPLSYQSLRSRQVRYRFFLAELLQTLSKEKSTMKKQDYLKFFHLYRLILNQLYSQLKYTFLMNELNIPKKAVLNFIKTGRKEIFLRVLLGLKAEIERFKRKILTLESRQRSDYLKKCGISPELFQEIKSW